MEIETELKYVLTDPRQWDQIFICQLVRQAAVQQAPECELLEARYFDTPSYALRNHRLAYRIRRERGCWIATVKADGKVQGALHQRQEYNVQVSGPEPSLAVFESTPVGRQLLAVTGGQPLQPLFITRFQRRTLNLRLVDGTEVELAADQGDILAGERSEPILEIELELKSGQAAALLEYGRQLACQLKLEPEPRSKFARALALAGL